MPRYKVGLLFRELRTTEVEADDSVEAVELAAEQLIEFLDEYDVEFVEEIP